MKTTSVIALLFTAALSACAADEDGTPDCEAPATFYPDADGDGFGASAGEEHCEMPAGFVAQAGDCDDDNAAIHPSGKEICDSADNDCDGAIDDADTSLDVATTGTFYRDGDGDNFGDATMTKKACVKPAGYAQSSSDCNDSAANVNPGALEVCDFVDNDCDAKIDIADSSIDPNSTKSFYRDFDNDKFGAGAAMIACNAPTGWVSASGDCNDNDNLSLPGGVEVCDNADNDCDGGIDGTFAQPNRCTALVGTYSGSYSHLTQEKLGSTVINSMSCSGTGSGTLLLTRRPGLQGTFTCVYSGSLGGFDQQQRVTLKATVDLTGAVKGTAEHEYDFGQKRTYNVTGTQTATSLDLVGTGSWYPHPMSAVPWTVSFTFDTAR